MATTDTTEGALKLMPPDHTKGPGKVGPGNVQELRDLYLEIITQHVQPLMGKLNDLAGPFVRDPQCYRALDQAMARLQECVGWIDSFCSLVETKEAQAKMRAAVSHIEKVKEIPNGP